MTKTSPKDEFSRQERRVLSFSIAGLGDKEIAREMGVALDTVRTYWQRIRAKVGGGTRAEIIATLIEEVSREELEAYSLENRRLGEEIALRRRSEARLNEAYLLAKMGCWEKCSTTGQFFFSETLYPLLEVDPERGPIGPAEFLQRVHRDDVEMVTRALYGLLDEGTPYELHYRYIAPSGRTRRIHSMGRADRDSSGNVLGVRGTMQDVTLYEAHLQSAEQASKTVVERERLLSEVMAALPEVPVVIEAEPLRVRFVGADFSGIPGLSGMDEASLEHAIFRSAASKGLGCGWRLLLKAAESLGDGDWLSETLPVAVAEGAPVQIRVRASAFGRDESGKPSRFLLLMSEA